MRIIISKIKNSVGILDTIGSELNNVKKTIEDVSRDFDLYDLTGIQSTITANLQGIKNLKYAIGVIIGEYIDLDARIKGKETLIKGIVNTNDSTNNNYTNLDFGTERLESYLEGKGWSSEDIRSMVDYIKENNPGALSSLYILDVYSGADYNIALNNLYNTCERNKEVASIVDKISEDDVYTKEAMFESPTYDLMARMIYQEMQKVDGGGQDKVLWATINRYFSEGNFTNGKEVTMRTILEEGQYESIDRNNNGVYNAYHPDYESDGWKNAKQLAAVIYQQVGDKESHEVIESQVRNNVSSSYDIDGNRTTNEIGDCDSFRGNGTENEFYQQYEGGN